ncbi:MAG: PAS domain S-box protein [Bacteroidales bacterium]|nr:PAS domain S-box protein [Bacteroidales bacterium]
MVKILLLEDNSTDAELTQRSLAASLPGCTIRIAPTLREARELIKSGDGFDIALLDMSLPDGNGQELLVEIRQTGIEMAVVMLTGSGNEEVAVAALKAGADDYMVKRTGYISQLPANIDYAIENYKHNQQIRAEQIRVLYIEHYTSDIDLTIRHFKQYAPFIQIDAVYSSEEALSVLTGKGNEAVKYDVLLMDYRMPGLNALEFIKIIRQERKLSIPIILVSGQGSEEVAIQALKLGVYEYLEKKENYLSRLPTMILNAYQHQEIVKKQTALAESEEKYRFMFANNPQPMWIYDIETLSFLEINDAAILHYGYTKDEFHSMTIKDIRPVEDITSLLNNITTSNDELYSFGEWRHVKKNGEIITVEIISHSLEFNNRKARHVMITDITKRKKAENELQISEEKFRNIFEYSIIGKSLTTIDGKHKINKAFSEILGYTEEEFSHYNWQDITHPDDIENDQNIINKIISGEDTYNRWEKRYIHKDGSIVWVDIITSLMRDKEGKPSFFITAINDITDRKLAEKELRKLSRAVEQSSNSIVITDLEGFIEYVNPQTLNLTGYSKEEMLGKKPNLFSSGEKSTDEYKELWDTIKSGKDWFGEFHNKKKNGEYYWEAASISPIFDENGSIIHFLAIKWDITESKKLQSELLIEKERAQESDRLKTAFLLNISHEIRTPMNGILGFAELLKEPGLSGDTQQEYINYIKVSSDRMLNIITDIVDISKIESGQMTVSLTETNINKQLLNIHSLFLPECNRKGIKLNYTIGLTDEESVIMTDRAKIFTILVHLVKNAIKYTKEGVIDIGYSIVKGTECALLEFYVKDTGIGIPQNRQQAIFDRFVQADIADLNAYQGAGLGLSISKAYAEMLAGNIRVKSEEGKGSIFYFTLPYNTNPKNEEITQKDFLSEKVLYPLKKLKVLITEDDETTVKILSLLLRKYSKEILTAQNGYEALQICQANSDLDLILMDMKMPVMDGFEATRQIRLLNENVIIIAQTAYGLPGDREKTIASGCNDYITKPMNKAEIQAVMHKYFGEKV